MSSGVGYWVNTGVDVADSGAGFPYSTKRVWGATYGVNRTFGVNSVLLKPVLGLYGFCAFYKDVSARARQNDEGYSLTV